MQEKWNWVEIGTDQARYSLTSMTIREERRLITKEIKEKMKEEKEAVKALNEYIEKERKKKSWKKKDRTV